MAALNIRKLDDDVVERLRIRAARNGNSMEAEIRAILVQAVCPEKQGPGLFSTLLDRFGALGGLDLELPPRSTPVRSAQLDT